MRTTYRKCRYCGDWHSVADWPDNHRDPEPERSPLAAPQVMRDTPEYMSPLGTGLITSRSQRREDLKRGDCREVDPSEFRKPEGWVSSREKKWRAKQAQQHGTPAAS